MGIRLMIVASLIAFYVGNNESIAKDVSRKKYLNALSTLAGGIIGSVIVFSLYSLIGYFLYFVFDKSYFEFSAFIFQVPQTSTPNQLYFFGLVSTALYLNLVKAILRIYKGHGFTSTVQPFIATSGILLFAWSLTCP